MCQNREKNRPKKTIVNVYNGFIIYFGCSAYKRRAGWSVKTIEYMRFFEDFRRRQSGFTSWETAFVVLLPVPDTEEEWPTMHFAVSSI